MSIKIHLSALIQLATADDDLADMEKERIYTIAEANGISKEEVDTLIKNPEPVTEGSFTDDDKFELLYNIVQLMKIDNVVFLSEIKFCEEVAEKLGFSKKVISEISGNIYADPKITANRDMLKQRVMKYKI